MKNKLLTPLIVAAIVATLTTASTVTVVVIRQNNIASLNTEIQELLDEYEILDDDISDLEAEFASLQNDYDALVILYNTILAELNAIKDYISNLILPAQYNVFAEAVRRYYLPTYLDQPTTKEFYMGYAEFCRDIILHDSNQYNSFSTVSNAFSDCLRYGSDSMYLAYYIMYNTFYDWLPNWAGYGLTGNEFTDLDTIIDWCIDEIEYEYDSDITVGQYSPTWDYPKFSIETAFRTMGDCEDQAILTAAYLESCGFETAMAMHHDPAHPSLGSFYHGTLLVHIEDTTLYNTLYPSNALWNLGSADPYTGYTWSWLDTTWDVPFGTRPSWLVGYSITFDILSLAICDNGGAIISPDIYLTSGLP
ncbi:MAG: transglutaminase-like domain-containing protein [Candidatus Heimdallarchaeota archaeon]